MRGYRSKGKKVLPLNDTNKFSFPFCPIEKLIPKLVDPKKDMVSFGSSVWKSRPFEDNEGGVSFEGAFYLYEILKYISPKLVVESGVWRGMTTYIIDNIKSVDSFYCFDPLVSRSDFIKYKSKSAFYYSKDFGSSCFDSIPASKNVSLAFFDDHQDQLERILLCYSRGYDWVLFDDNYAFGGGDHASLCDHIRKSSQFDISGIISEIYICPPAFMKNKGLAPKFIEIPPELNEFLGSSNNQYNWMTLCSLKKPNLFSMSQGVLPLSE